MRRWIFPLFLTFSVVYYSQRFLMGWGSSVSVYEHDIPDSLKIVKDLAWVAFLCGVLICRFYDLDLAITQIKRNWRFYSVLALFVWWIAVAGFIHAIRGDNANDVLLYWYRYPLEYIPMVALVPALFDEPRLLGRLTVWLGAVTLLFLIFEMLSGRQNGFQWSELGPTRYGSIFGSPNDFGVFCAFMVLGLVVYSNTKWQWFLAAGMVLGLVLSISRSAWVAFFIGLVPLLHFRRIRLFGISLLLAFAALVAVLGVYQGQSIPAQATFITDRVSFDDSTAIRIDEINEFLYRFSDLDDLAKLAFGTSFFRIEDLYLAWVVRAGVLGLFLFLTVAVMTLHRGWKFRRRSKLHAVALSTVLVILVASLFVPFLDLFPTNLYFWIAVGIVWLPLEQIAPAHSPCLNELK